MRSEGERNEQKIGAEQEGKRDAALRGVVHVKSSWREEEVYVASGNHFSVVHGAGWGGVCWGWGVGGVFARAHAVFIPAAGIWAPCKSMWVLTRLVQVRRRARLWVGRGLICWWVGQEPQRLCADFNAVLEIIKVSRASAAEQRTDSDSRTAQRAPRQQEFVCG